MVVAFREGTGRPAGERAIVRQRGSEGQLRSSEQAWSVWIFGDCARLSPQVCSDAILVANSVDFWKSAATGIYQVATPLARFRGT